MWFAEVNEDNEVVREVDLKDEPSQVKLLPNGLRKLRPMVLENPPLQPWQDFGAPSYEVRNDIVIRNGSVVDKDVNELRSQKKAAVDELLLVKSRDGLVIQGTGGKILQVRPEDQANITAMAVQAALALTAGVQWPANFRWRMKANDYLPLPTPQSMIQLAAAAAQYVLGARSVGWAHKDALEQLQTAEAVYNYDITAGL